MAKPFSPAVADNPLPHLHRMLCRLAGGDTKSLPKLELINGAYELACQAALADPKYVAVVFAREVPIPGRAADVAVRIWHVPVAHFIALGRAGMEEQRGRVLRGDWLRALGRSWAGRTDLALLKWDTRFSAELVADVAYATARARHLERIEALAAAGVPLAVLFVLQDPDPEGEQSRNPPPVRVALLPLPLPPPNPTARFDAMITEDEAGWTVSPSPTSSATTNARPRPSARVGAGAALPQPVASEVKPMPNKIQHPDFPPGASVAHYPHWTGGIWVILTPAGIEPRPEIALRRGCLTFTLLHDRGVRWFDAVGLTGAQAVLRGGGAVEVIFEDEQDARAFVARLTGEAV